MVINLEDHEVQTMVDLLNAARMVHPSASSVIDFLIDKMRGQASDQGYIEVRPDVLEKPEKVRRIKDANRKEGL